MAKRIIPTTVGFCDECRRQAEAGGRLVVHDYPRVRFDGRLASFVHSQPSHRTTCLCGKMRRAHTTIKFHDRAPHLTEGGYHILSAKRDGAKVAWNPTLEIWEIVTAADVPAWRFTA